ncbi:UNVERIFIED_CONTAM: hypothetical protein PYX00_002102 [Menopon gallinae]|uniref:Uncharacterized protein n=1 Tax=Menopon gallinae TaxID=328185 RepID=A0AAW2IGS7_9NEOP
MVFEDIGIMYTRVILLFIAAVYGGTPLRYYESQIAPKTDSTADNANVNVGFVQPLYFKSFTRHPFDGSPAESRAGAGVEYAQPVHFVSSFNSDGSKDNAYKIQRYLNPRAQEQSGDQTPKATEELSEESDFHPLPKRSFRQSPKQKGRPYGKSDITGKASKRRPDPAAMEYYTDLYSTQKDVEMILPKEKSIILPMVNGKPKPYQGYRAAPDSMPYGSDEGDIIYGKPKKGAGSVRPYRIKRSPAEYHGGIYPHFDYSDPENAGRVSQQENVDRMDKSSHQKRGYPKKYRSKSSGKPNNYYKYPKGNRRTSKRSSEEQAEDDDDEEEEEEDEPKTPPYKYKYDSSFVIPQLEIKYYPYERQLKAKHKDNKEEGTEDEETYESKIDEYTAGYEAYKKSLPTDLESYFGKPDFGDYSVEATENLEENKNCEKVARQDQASENSTEEASGKGKEVCYICRDPKTGGSYEQCAYQSEPKSEKYYYGGSTSFHKDESPEPVNYRYRRSAFGEGFDLDKFVFGRESDGRRKTRQNPERSPYDKPRKRYRKNWKHDDDYPYESHSREDHYGSPSSRRSKSKNKEGPPDSYDGPKYTIENDDDESSQANEESQSQPKKEYYEYNTYHPPDRRYSPSSRRSKYSSEPRRDREEVEDDGYKPDTSYNADYRFGPEHFVDDEVEEERPREKQKSESKPKPPEKRQKHSGSESRPAPATDDKEKDAGNVKVFKNGDVCRKKKVDGMICMVCKNEKTAATYEQCQYSSKPKDKYYAFGSQKSYRTSDPNAERRGREDEEDQHPEKSDVIEKKILITKQSKVFQDNSGPLDSLPNVRSLQGDLLGSPSDNLETHMYNPNNNDTNRQVSESIMRMEPRDGIEGLEEYLYSDSDDSEKKATDEDREYRSYDDYFHDIFPEFSQKKESSPYSEESKESEEEDEAEESEESESERHVNFDPFSNIRKFKDNNPPFLEEYSADEEEESREASNEEPLRLKDQKSRVPADFFLEDSEDYHKKDIEKALGEFQSRDWSNCKKIVKNKLTCYQCVDKNGVNNEECMYVEASQPLKKHMAYHERKELKPEGPIKEKEEMTEPAPTEAPSAEAPKVARRMRGPKNSREAEEAAAPAEESRRRPIGDYEGVAAVPEEDVMTPVPSLTTEAVAEDTTEKPQLRTIKRNQKRIKTSKKAVETTTERARKRKYPVKKFNDDTGTITDATESVTKSWEEAAAAAKPGTNDTQIK